MVGHRQKRLRAQEDELEAAGDAHQTEGLGLGFVEMWAIGAMSATQVQHMSLLAEQSGCQDPDIKFLANMGSRGQTPANCARDIHRKYCSGVQLPEPYRVNAACINRQADGEHAICKTDISIFLPHEWMHHLSYNHPAEFERYFNPSRISHFWRGCDRGNPKLWRHPVLAVRDWQNRAIPLLVHGDAASFCNRDSLMSYSMKGLLTESPSSNHLLLACFPKSCSADLKRHACDTWEDIWWVLRWSFEALLVGVHPSVDAYGESFPPQSQQAKLAGTPIMRGGLVAVAWGILGDLELLYSIGAPHHSKDRFCWRCGAGRSVASWTSGGALQGARPGASYHIPQPQSDLGCQSTS